MAITKVIAIRSRLDSRVNYVTNSKKTTLAAGLCLSNENVSKRAPKK